MMSKGELIALLHEHSEHGNDDPLMLGIAELKLLEISDVPEGATICPGERTADGTFTTEWDGVFFKEDGTFVVETRETNYRKFWYSPLNLEHYCDLLYRAVLLRQKRQKDVEAMEMADDGAFITLVYRIFPKSKNLGEIFEEVKRVEHELRSTAEEVSDQVGLLAAKAAGQLSRYDDSGLEDLITVVNTSTDSNEKGSALEELLCRLLETVPGFKVQDRVTTTTEEIDVVIQNNSDAWPWKSEPPLVLVECKNWSTSCGKNELVPFLAKIQNRRGRCAVGIFVSWNGYAKTFHEELLRDSKGSLVIITLCGDEVTAAAIGDHFQSLLEEGWKKATLT